MESKKRTKTFLIIGLVLAFAISFGLFQYFSTNQAFFEGQIVECYQEQADTTSICGGLGGGSYSDIKNSNDGDWVTSSLFKQVPEQYDYEVPDNTVGAYIKLKLEDDAGTIYNIQRTVPSACINDFIYYDMYYERPDGGQYNVICYDDSWNEYDIYSFYNARAGRLYEDAMIWKIRQETECWTIVNDVCTNTLTLTCNDGFQSISDCELYQDMGGLFNITPIDISDLRDQVDELDGTVTQNDILLTEARQDITETDSRVDTNEEGIEENRNSIMFFLSGLLGLSERVDDNADLISANTDSIIANGLAIDSNNNLINANGLLISANGDRIDANEVLINSNGDLITANGVLISANNDLIDANGNLIDANGLRITTNENAITSIWANFWGLKDNVTANTNQISANVDLITAQGLLINSNGDLITANGVLITNNGDRIDANEVSINANGDLITANGLLITANGVLIQANADAITSLGLEVDANGDLITANGNLITANGLRIDATELSILSNGNLISVNGDLITANGVLISANADAIDLMELDVDVLGNLITANGLLISANGDRIDATELSITSNGNMITANGLLIGANGVLISDNTDLINANGLLINDNNNLIIDNGNLITANGDLISANGVLISANGDLIDANGNLITANGLRIDANEGAIAGFFSDLLGLHDEMEAEIGVVNNRLSQVEYDAIERDGDTNERIDALDLRVTENEETNAEIIVSLFRLDGILGSQCWILEENYCVRDTVSEVCEDFTSKRRCQETVICWEIQGDNCYDSHASECAGFTTEELCIAEIPAPVVTTVTYTTTESEALVNDMITGSATSDYSAVEGRIPLVNQIVDFWNGIWN